MQFGQYIQDTVDNIRISLIFGTEKMSVLEIWHLLDNKSVLKICVSEKLLPITFLLPHVDME